MIGVIQFHILNLHYDQQSKRSVPSK